MVHTYMYIHSGDLRLISYAFKLAAWVQKYCPKAINCSCVARLCYTNQDVALDVAL